MGFLSFCESMTGCPLARGCHSVNGRLQTSLLALLMSAWACDRPTAAPPVAPQVDLTRAVRWIGRADLRAARRVGFSWSGSGFEAHFVGSGIDIALTNESEDVMFDVTLDGAAGTTFRSHANSGRYTLAAGLPNGPHTLSFTRETEGQLGTSWLTDIAVHEGVLSDVRSPVRPLLEFVGDSYTAGYGALGGDALCPFSTATESFTLSYAGRTARALHAEASGIAASGHGLLRNLDGLSEDVLPSLYDRAVCNEPEPAWTFARHPDVVVVALGSNDFDAGTDDPSAAFGDAYADFVAELRNRHPEAWIVCVVGPMFREERATTGVRWEASVEHVMQARRALGDTRVRRIVFPSFEDDDFGCDYHPHAKKHAILGDLLAEFVRPLLDL